jgi:hypothetical protein
MSKTIDIKNLSICFRNGNSGTVEKSENVFQEGVRFTEEWDIGEGSRKRRKYLYFDQLLFLLPHIEDRETHSNLNTLNDEEEANNSQGEKKERPRNVRKKKRTEISYEESLLQILQQKKMDDADVDEDKCFLLSLLPSFKQFNDEQKFLARMEILKIMRHVRLKQNFDTHLPCSLPSFSNANSFPPNSSHFASNPINSQPVTSMQNSEIISRYLSSYSVDPQRPPTSTTVLPQYHNSPCSISSNAPPLPGEDGNSNVSSLLSVGSTAHL